MKQPQLTKPVSKQIVAEITTATTVLTTGWLLAAGASTFNITQELRQIVGPGGIATNARYRYASVSRQRPGPWTTSGVDRLADGIFGEDINSVAANQMWMQFAIAARTNPAGPSECFAKLQGSVQGNGTLVADETVQVTPISNTGQSIYVALGRKFPQLGISKLMYGITFTGVKSTISYRPVYREIEAQSDAELNVNDWSDIGSGVLTQAVDGDVNLSSSMTVTRTAGYMYGQAGIRFFGDARGTLRITVAAIF